jgi:hypothetical protein
MPLPSILNGAKQCQVLTKRTRQRCKNPAAYGSEKACRMHGSHRSRNVPRGPSHSQYKNGEETKEAKASRSTKSTTLLTLRDIGDSINLFNGGHTRGRKPNGYQKYNLEDSKQMMEALLKVKG